MMRHILMALLVLAPTSVFAHGVHCPKITQCRTNFDCTKGGVCDPVLRYCVERIRKPFRYSKELRRLAKKYGRTLPPIRRNLYKAMCSTVECPYGYICRKGRCERGIDVSCNSDADCLSPGMTSGEHSCRNNRCVLNGRKGRTFGPTAAYSIGAVNYVQLSRWRGPQTCKQYYAIQKRKKLTFSKLPMPKYRFCTSKKGCQSGYFCDKRLAQWNSSKKTFARMGNMYSGVKYLCVKRLNQACSQGKDICEYGTMCNYQTDRCETLQRSCVSDKKPVVTVHSALQCQNSNRLNAENMYCDRKVNQCRLSAGGFCSSQLECGSKFDCKQVRIKVGKKKFKTMGRCVRKPPQPPVRLVGKHPVEFLGASFGAVGWFLLDSKRVKTHSRYGGGFSGLFDFNRLLIQIQASYSGKFYDYDKSVLVLHRRSRQFNMFELRFSAAAYYRLRFAFENVWHFPSYILLSFGAGFDVTLGPFNRRGPQYVWLYPKASLHFEYVPKSGHWSIVLEPTVVLPGVNSSKHRFRRYVWRWPSFEMRAALQYRF